MAIANIANSLWEGRALRTGVIVSAVALALSMTACGSGGGDASKVQGIPDQWLKKTAEGWPKSDGHGSSNPVLSSKNQCLLGKTPPKVLGQQPEFTAAGWGPIEEADQGYQYLCDHWLPDRAAGSLTLTQAPDDETAAAIAEKFRSTRATSIRDSSVQVVTVGNLEIPVIKTWIPSNPQGSYEAQYYDKAKKALVTLDISGLNEADFAAMNEQTAAELLVQQMAK